MIVGLLLAAGAARRFGAPKLVQHLAGKPLVRWSADALAAAADRTVVVVPPEGAVITEALRGLPVSYVTNPAPERGLGASIARGVAALPGESEAVVVALADEPALDARWIEAVIARYRAGREGGHAAIVAPVFRGTRRHPVLFDRSVFAELSRLDGDAGARAVVERDPGRVALVEFDEPGTIDVDTPEDLARLAQAPQFTARQSSRTS
ncbi:MAG: nucleotidyltransferase family protein [Gemmatimonadaceae bacterium]